MTLITQNQQNPSPGQHPLNAGHNQNRNPLTATEEMLVNMVLFGTFDSPYDHTESDPKAKTAA